MTEGAGPPPRPAAGARPAMRTGTARRPRPWSPAVLAASDGGSGPDHGTRGVPATAPAVLAASDGGSGPGTRGV